MAKLNFDDPNTVVIYDITVAEMRKELDLMFVEMEADLLTRTTAPKLTDAVNLAAKNRRVSSPDVDAVSHEFRSILYRYFIQAFLHGAVLARKDRDV